MSLLLWPWLWMWLWSLPFLGHVYSERSCWERAWGRDKSRHLATVPGRLKGVKTIFVNLMCDKRNENSTGCAEQRKNVTNSAPHHRPLRPDFLWENSQFWTAGSASGGFFREALKLELSQSNLLPAAILAGAHWCPLGPTGHPTFGWAINIVSA